jgi:hypothetical protein
VDVRQRARGGGKFEVFSTWMPACCSPLNGVTTGAVLPFSQPSLKGRFGSLNQIPRWNWCVGLNVVVPPGDTENVSRSKMPCTVAVPEPSAPTLTSDWYHETPNGLFGNWMTKRSNWLWAGMPQSLTFMTSLSDPGVIQA